MLDEVCPYCGEQPPFEVHGVFAELREIDAQFCCEDYREAFGYFINELDAEEFRAFWRAYFKQWDDDNGGLLKACGLDVRRVLHDTPCDDFTLDFNPTVRLLSGADNLKMAQAWVSKWHRSREAATGWRFGLAAYNGLELIAVAMVGRPVAPKISPYFTVEVNRLCVRTDLRAELTFNACSLLYGAAAREAERRGFLRAITYTRRSESGASLKATGWTPRAATTREGQTWNVPSRPREVTAREQDGAEEKIKWTRKLRPPRRKAEALAKQAEQARIKRGAERGQLYLWEAAA